MADWSKLQAGHRIQVFNKPFADLEAAAQALQGFEVLGIMRERTPFPRALFDKLPALKLLVTTGKRNASVDLAAAKDRGVLVCNTGGAGRATAELAIGLMIGLARHLDVEFQNMRSGGWQTTVGFDLDGKTLGLIGLGNLGGKVARIGKAIGMKTIAWSENLTPERAQRAGRRARRQGRAVPAGRRDLHQHGAVAAHARAGRRARARPDEADGAADQHLARADRRRGGAAGGAAREAHRRIRRGCVRHRAAAGFASAAEPSRARC